MLVTEQKIVLMPFYEWRLQNERILKRFDASVWMWYDVPVLIQCMKRWSDNSAWIFEKLVWYFSVNEWKISDALVKLGWYFSVNLWRFRMMLQRIKGGIWCFSVKSWPDALDLNERSIICPILSVLNPSAKLYMLDHRSPECFKCVPMFYNPLQHSLYF
jgi:hypothetical protein